MSSWTHNLCDECWALVREDEPFKSINAKEEICCMCAQPHTSGIYLREHPLAFFCQGIHPYVPLSAEITAVSQ